MNANEIVKFRLNELNENTIQIYGTINGICMQSL